MIVSRVRVIVKAATIMMNGTPPSYSFTTTMSEEEQLSSEDRSWYLECLTIMAKDKLGLNLGSDETAVANSLELIGGNETSISSHFDQSTESICNDLLKFKNEPMSVFSESTQKTITLIYSVLMVVGILTNLSVCWVVVRNSQARTARNLFIINMAFSDLTVCFITMPFTMQRILNHSWKYGDALCRLTSMLEGVNLLVSSGTASAIAGDRLCLVKRKTARDDTKVTKIGSIILLIWFLAILAILPTTFSTGLIGINFANTSLVMSEVCVEKWPLPSLHLVYSILLMLVQYIIPISVILVTHTQIIGIVRKRTEAATSFRRTNRANVTMKRNKKTTQILLIIAGMFGIHWLPYHMYTIGSEVIRISSLDWKLSSHDELFVFFLVHSFAMLSTITNPILYGWLNTNLKHLFRAMIPTVRNERHDHDERTTSPDHQQLTTNGGQARSCFYKFTNKSIRKHFKGNLLRDQENIVMNDLNGGMTMHETLTPNGSPEVNQDKKIEENRAGLLLHNTQDDEAQL